MSLSSKALTLMATGFLALVNSSCALGVEKDEPVARRGTYVYCNVYLGEACFGIAAGDDMKMTVPADYVLYEIRSADNRNAIVYYGYNQSIVDPALNRKFESCTQTNEACVFVFSSGEQIEAIYSGDRKGSTVHLLLTGIDQANRKRADEFVENFRPCKRVGYDLMCQNSAIFALP